MSRSAGNAVIAKARALYGKGITKEQYQDMLNCHSVSEIASFLKNSTLYSEVLENTPESTIHRGQLESLLRRNAFQNYTKLYHYLNTSSENIFHYIILELELRQILQMVRLLKADNPEAFILQMPGYLVARTDIDLMSLAHVRSFDELLRLLEKSHFGNILKRFKPTDDNPKIDYVACEHALYEYHFRRVFHMFDKTKGAERIELKRIYGMRVDQLNLRNIYRSLKNFNADPKNAAKMVFPFHRKLKPSHIDDMLHAQSGDQLQKMLQELFETSGASKKVHPPEGSMIETYTDMLQLHACRNALHLSAYTSVVFYSYFILSQIELSNLVHIIEGIRYQVPKEEINKLLVV